MTHKLGPSNAVLERKLTKAITLGPMEDLIMSCKNEPAENVDI